MFLKENKRVIQEAVTNSIDELKHLEKDVRRLDEDILAHNLSSQQKTDARTRLQSRFSSIVEKMTAIDTLNQSDVPLGSDLLTYVDMPDLIGMTEAQADSAVSALGFSEVTKLTENDTADVGTVFRQRPDAGTFIPRNRSLRYTVSLGV